MNPKLCKNLLIAVAGNPNSGKTTIFNALTNSTQKVGNWSGVTVEKIEAQITCGNVDVHFVDLPGTYSLSAYSMEEKIARDFLLYEHPDVVLAVIDASNLERNLYFLAQLIDMGHPTVIALNMIDIAEAQGINIDANKLSLLLGAPVIKTIGTTDKGKEELMLALMKVAQTQTHPKRLVYQLEVEEAIRKMQLAVSGFHEHTDLPACHIKRYFITKLLEGDESLLARTFAQCPEFELLENKMVAIRKDLELIFDDDISSIMARSRFAWAEGLHAETVQMSRKVDEKLATDVIDSFVLNKYLGFPIFALIMFMIFLLTFSIGNVFGDSITVLFEYLSSYIRGIFEKSAPLLASLLADGVLAGVGGVVSFLPNIAILFFLIALLEDSGYMARAAFLMDNVMHRFGLHGRSFIPVVLGFGCSVPAITATRALRDAKDKLATVLMLPFVPCSARLPVLILFASMLFEKNTAIIIFAMYVLGVFTALLVAAVLKRFFLGGLTTPFVMELPNYHIPAKKVVVRHTLLNSSSFLKKAGTVILMGALTIWTLSALPFGVEYAGTDCLAAQLGRLVEPIFAPLGISWQGIVALIFGFVAKEIVVSSLSVLYHSDAAALTANLAGDFPFATAMAFLVFAMLYTPCVATLGAIKAETGSLKWAVLSALFSFAIAWFIAFLTYEICSLLIHL